MKFIGTFVAFLALAGFAMAIDNRVQSVPEIDANSFASGLALISGGLLVIRGRRAK